MFDVDHAALDRMAEAQWHRLMNQNIVFEMPADPAHPVAVNAMMAGMSKDVGIAGTRVLSGIPADEFRDNVSRLGEEVARHIKTAKGYDIRFLDRTKPARQELARLTGNEEFAKQVGPYLDKNSNPYSAQIPAGDGGTVCMVMAASPHAEIAIPRGNVTKSALHKWMLDHELGHCLNAAGRNVAASVSHAVSEELADTFAALKAIRDGAPSDLVPFMAAEREHREWQGTDAGDPHITSKVLWKIAEMQDMLSKSEKFRSLDVEGLAGLARNVQARYGMTKKEMIFVRDVRDAMLQVYGKGHVTIPGESKGQTARISFDHWKEAMAAHVPEIRRLLDVQNSLLGNPADLGSFKLDEKRFMASMRELARQGDSGAKLVVKILTDGKVAKMRPAEIFDANLGRPTTLADVLGKDRKDEVAAVEASSTATAPDAAPGTEPVAEEMVSEAGLQPTGTVLPSPDASPAADRSDAVPAKPSPTVSIRSQADVEEALVNVSRSSLAGAREVEETIRQVIEERSRIELAKAEAARGDVALFASRIAFAASQPELRAETVFGGIELPPAPGMFDEPRKSPSMVDMPGYSTAERTEPTKRMARLSTVGLNIGAMPSQAQMLVAGLPRGQEPQFKSAGFINGSDISRLLDMGRPLEFGGFNAQRDFVNDIVTAARDTQMDPITLLAMCAQESGLGKQNEAKTSTGRGPFQFLEQTWLHMVKNHGHKYGMEAEAAKISVGKNGRMKVDDPVAKQQILKLRYNTYLSAAIAGEMIQLSREGIEKSIKRSLTTEELYLSHVMGEGGARKLLNLSGGKRKNERADRFFRKAAQANEGLFYKEEGGRRKPVSNAELHERMTEKISKLREHFVDAINVIDSGFRTADLSVSGLAMAESELREYSQPSYVFGY